MKFHSNSADSDLLQACLEKNPLGQKYLYQKYYSPMMALCMRYAGEKEEALRILNNAFFKVLTCIDQFDGSGELGAWIRRIVHNAAIDELRKKARYQERFDANVEADSPVFNEAISNLTAAEILKRIQELEPNYRMVFCLYVIEGFKHQEIAARLNISVGTSKWYLSKAKKMLQKKILSSYNSEVA